MNLQQALSLMLNVERYLFINFGDEDNFGKVEILDLPAGRTVGQK